MDLAGLRLHRRHVVEAGTVRVEAAEATERVAPPGAVVDLVSHRLAELAVAGDGHARGDLLGDDVAHCSRELGLERGLVEARVLALLPDPVQLDELVGAGKASRVAGEDGVGAVAHPLSIAATR